VELASLTAIQYARQIDYPAFRKAYRKYRYPSSGYTYFGFNLKDPRFADRRVRQAFAHAIDKQELINGVVMGFAREATGPIRPGTWAYTDEVRRYEFSPERAKQLLAQAGWVDRDGDGLVEDKDGKPFAFTIRTNQGNEERKKVAEIIQQRLLTVGVKAEIQVIEWAALQSGPDQLNQISYANPQVDEALEKGRASCEQRTRLPHYRRFQQLLAEDQPLVFLYFRDALPVVSARVRGIDPGPAGILHNFTRWFVPRELQRYTSG
jgi:peptide/nickel transport system substrate-binding protein